MKHTEVISVINSMINREQEQLTEIETKILDLNSQIEINQKNISFLTNYIRDLQVSKSVLEQDQK